MAEPGRYEEAVRAFDRALELNPSDPEALAGKGQVLAQLGHYEEAVRAFDWALALEPDNLEAHVHKGLALRNIGRYEEALGVFDRVLELDPDYPEAWVSRGRVLAQLGHYDETLNTLHPIRQHHVSFQGRSKDPDPISLGFLIYGAVIASASLVVAIANRVDTEQSRREERERDEAQVRMYLGRIDRTLNQLDEAFRSLVSVFDQHEVLNAPFTLGASPIFADETLIAEIRRLQNTYFNAGRDLYEALDELSSRIGYEMQNEAQQISRELVALFEESRVSRTVVAFVIDVGRMLERLSAFIMQVGERYRYSSIPARVRQAALDETIRYLTSE